MDNRLIFLYLGYFVISWGETKSDKPGAVVTMRLSGKSVPTSKSIGATASRDENWSIFDRNWAVVNFREKLRNEKCLSPYRKPTQVGWSRRLRRAGEPSLRNSAN